ncbi:hypothetical protein NC652_019538 [Populus alba x Populus x berolinensis]|nr:hypothetical protein NC651_018687 [Populus alba x Populus x berolinensis]KAJ6917192.1 hypothetical protein NC652_019538 [Populus alba x Populus x berolinensis]
MDRLKTLILDFQFLICMDMTVLFNNSREPLRGMQERIDHRVRQRQQL